MTFWDIAQLVTVRDVYGELQTVAQVRRLFLFAAALWRRASERVRMSENAQEALRTLEELVRGRARLRDLMEFWTRAHQDTLDRDQILYHRWPVPGRAEWAEGEAHPAAWALMGDPAWFSAVVVTWARQWGFGGSLKWSTVEEDIAHDILGDPGQRARPAPACVRHSADVRALLRVIDESPEPDELGYLALADALDEAGFQDQAALAHCRQSRRQHFRGCWVIEWLSGRERLRIDLEEW